MPPFQGWGWFFLGVTQGDALGWNNAALLGLNSGFIVPEKVAHGLPPHV